MVNCNDICWRLPDLKRFLLLKVARMYKGYVWILASGGKDKKENEVKEVVLVYLVLLLHWVILHETCFCLLFLK